jgi:hypothetical protein
MYCLIVLPLFFQYLTNREIITSKIKLVDLSNSIYVWIWT